MPKIIESVQDMDISVDKGETSKQKRARLNEIKRKNDEEAKKMKKQKEEEDLMNKMGESSKKNRGKGTKK